MPIPERILDLVLAASNAKAAPPKFDRAMVEAEQPRDTGVFTRWVDAAGMPLDTDRPFQSITAPVEGFRTGGTIDMQERLVARSIEQHPPGAHALEFRSRTGLLASVGRAELTRAEGPMPPVDPKRWPDTPTGDLFFPIFSERFTDRERFYAFANELNAFVRTIAPFDRPAIGNRLQLRAYYWPSPSPDRGWFDSPDIPFDCASGETSLFFGNREIAKARLGHLMYRRKYGLVLVDSGFRGGAGGQAEYGYPAWSTITSCPGEDWRAIAVHEIGHAFGLGDEYVLDSLAHQSTQGEPNIGINAAHPPAAWPTTAGWGGGTVTEDQQATMDARTPGTEQITGFFEGARYRRDYCRPSLNCLMKSITKIPSLGRYAFCDVCEGALANALAGP